jgi:hypothetical protein
VPFVAVEEPDAEPALKRGDRAGQRGLGEVQSLGGDPVIQGFGERQEVAQVPDLRYSALIVN